MIGGGTYGPMGGGVANAEVSGEMQGFGDVETLKTNAQQRNIQQQKWALQSQLEMDKVKKSHMNLLMQQKEAWRTGAFTQENFEYLNNKTKSLEQQVKMGQKDFLGQLMSRYFGSDDPDDELDSINNSLKGRPDVAASLGFQGEMRPLSIGSQYDRKMLANTLMQQDPTFASATPEMQKQMLDSAIASKNYFVVDNRIMDAKGLSIATGSWNSLPADVKRKATRREAGKTVATKTTKAKAPETPKYEIDPNTGERVYTNPNGDTIRIDPVDKATGVKKPDAEVDADYQKIVSEMSPQQATQTAEAQPQQTTATPAQSFGTSDAYINRLAKKEGFRAKAYKDGDSYSIGYGHKIKPGEEYLMNAELSEEAAMNLLKADAKDHYDQMLKVSPWVAEAPDNVRTVAADLAYNMGPAWEKKLPGVAEAMKSGDYETAARKLLNTKYASQVKGRAVENAAILTGQSPASYSGSAGRSGAGGSSSLLPSNWRDRPYDASDLPTKGDVIRNIAGWQDNRTALEKNMDYVGSQLGPNATMGEVVDVLSEWQQSRYGTREGKTFSWERRIEANNALVDDMVARKEITPEEGEEMKRDYTRRMMVAGTEGMGQNKEDQDVKQIAQAAPKYAQALQTGQIGQKELGDLIAQEAGIKADKATMNDMVETRQFSDVVRTGQQLANEIERLEGTKDSSGQPILQQGLWDSLKQAGEEYLSPDGLSAETIKKLETTAAVNTKLGDFVAQYLKALSGLAVSDPERREVYRRLGADFGRQPGVTIAKLRAFTQANRNRVRQRADRLARRGFGGSALEGRVAIGDLQMVDAKGAAVVQGIYGKPMKPSTRSSATNQIDDASIGHYKVVNSHEALTASKEPARWKAPNGQWIYNNKGAK